MSLKDLCPYCVPRPAAAFFPPASVVADAFVHVALRIASASPDAAVATAAGTLVCTALLSAAAENGWVAGSEEEATTALTTTHAAAEQSSQRHQQQHDPAASSSWVILQGRGLGGFAAAHLLTRLLGSPAAHLRVLYTTLAAAPKVTTLAMRAREILLPVLPGAAAGVGAAQAPTTDGSAEKSFDSAAAAELLISEGVVPVGRAAIELALARAHREVIGIALSSAIERIDLSLRAAVAESVARRSAGGDGRSGGGASGAPANAAVAGAPGTPYDKALYGALRCIGRWGELRQQSAAAAAQVEAAEQALEDERVSAHVAADYIETLSRQQLEAAAATDAAEAERAAAADGEEEMRKQRRREDDEDGLPLTPRGEGSTRRGSRMR